MSEELIIPKLGQTVEEVTLIRWLVEDKSKVKSGQEVLEVETDKAIFPVETYNGGMIHIGPYHEGDVIPVLTVVAVIGKETDSFDAYMQAQETGNDAVSLEVEPAVQQDSVPMESSEKPAGGQPGERLFASPRARMLAAKKNVDLGRVSPTGGGGQRVAERDVIAYLEQTPRATPVASRMAADKGLDLHAITGSGPSGKITKEDIQRQLQQSVIETEPAPDRSAEIIGRVPLKGVRGIIAERMSASLHNTAQVTLTSEVDMSAMVKIREQIKADVSGDWDFTPGYNDLIALITARTLKDYPYMNARLNQEEGVIEHLARVNLGMAVDTERGLLVPVIRGADQMGLKQFGTQFRQLADRARSGRSMPDDLTGGTFTITNLGMYDIDAFTPIINLPETAILGVGRIHQKPAVFRGRIRPRHLCLLSLVFDHRLVDGAPAARFLQQIKRVLENPYLLIL